MPRPKWKTNLVNAFPIPEDRKPKKLQAKSPEEEQVEDDKTFKPRGTFPLLDLPSELRYRIYNLVLFHNPDPVGGNGPDHEIQPTCQNLSLLLLSKRIHAESTHILYSTTTFRLFPLQDFQFLPTPPELAPHYRSHITRLSIILGSSWTAPPAAWKVTKGLARCLSRIKLVRTLRVFVQLDPSQPMFAKHRVSYSFYTDFCGDLLRDVLKAMPKLESVELAGYAHVEPNGPLVSRLREEAEAKDKTVRWGRECGWYELMVEGKGRSTRAATTTTAEDEAEKMMGRLTI